MTGGIMSVIWTVWSGAIHHSVDWYNWSLANENASYCSGWQCEILVAILEIVLFQPFKRAKGRFDFVTFNGYQSFNGYQWMLCDSVHYSNNDIHRGLLSPSDTPADEKYLLWVSLNLWNSIAIWHPERGNPAFLLDLEHFDFWSCVYLEIKYWWFRWK